MSMIRYVLQRLDSKKIVFTVLLLVFFSILFLQNNQAGFDKGHHGFLSSHGSAIAKNLSLETNFLMYECIFINQNEELSYRTYNRFPVTAFLLIKAVMSIFSPDLSMEVLIARQLMNLFFIGAILFVFFSVYELTRSRIAAVTVSLLSFSSFYLQYYNDMIFNDTPTLFGFVMTFHGIVVYHLHQRKPQLFLKALFGLCLGWHIFSMLLAYIVFLSISDFYQNRSVSRLLKSDQFKLGLLSLLVGILLLGVNFVNEAVVTNKPITEIDSFQSAKNRIGQDNAFQKQYDEYLALGAFSSEQLHRIGAMAIPYFFKDSGNFKIAGGIILILTLLGCCLSKNRVLLLTLWASGFLWAYPMRGYTFSHDYQSIYYIGIPVILFYMIVNGVPKKMRAILPLILLLSVIVFIATNVEFNRSKAINAHKTNPVTYDFQNIINYTQGGNIFFIDGIMSEIAYGYHAVEFYLSGNYFTENKGFAEYIVSKNRNYNAFLLTPSNSKVFLFGGNPHFARAFTKRGIGSYKNGNYSEAIQDYSQSLKKDPYFVEAYINRGIAQKKTGDYRGAIDDYNKALQISPDRVDVLNNLSWIMSTCSDATLRNGKKALALAQKSIDLNYGPLTLDTLAAAYAENSRFDKAVETQREAIRILKKIENSGALKEFEKHLTAYAKGKAWRD